MIIEEVYSCPFNLDEEKIRVLLEVTKRCNQKCIQCFEYESNNAEGIASDLPLDKLQIIMNQVANDELVEQVWITGGEPLVRKDIVDVISIINGAGKKPSISTNGIAFTPELVKQVASTGVKYVHLSLDGNDPHTHDFIRGTPRSYNRTINAINMLHEQGISTGVSCVLNIYNVSQAEGIIQIADSLGVGVVSFYPPSPGGRTEKNKGKFLGKKELQKVYKTLRAIEVSYSPKIELFRLEGDSGIHALKQCNGENFLTITNKGELGACPWHLNSYMESPTIQLTINNWFIAKEQIRKQFGIIKTDFYNNLEGCVGCEVSSECGQGCPAQGKYDSLCNVVKK